MTNPVGWIKAQVDEDERLAPEVHSAWCPGIETSGALYAVVSERCSCGWPARVVAEVKSKRRMLDLIDELDRSADVDAGPTAQQLLRALALAYRDREGYRESLAS